METRVLYWMLILVIGTADMYSAMPSFGSNHEVQNVDVSDKVDGYEFATLYAVDTLTNDEKKQTWLDIEQFTSDLTSDHRIVSLHLTSGAQLRISLRRRPINASGAKFLELTEDGDTKVIQPQAVSCFFTGTLEGKEGFASLSTCHGKLMGTISTPSRDYEISLVPQAHQSGDEVIVLVTWQNAEHEDMVLQQQLSNLSSDDGLEITEDDDEDESNKVARRSVTDRNITIEIADFVDKYYIDELRRTRSITTNEEIINFIYHKWNGAAKVLSNIDAVGWNVTLRLVQVTIWRKNPDWYVTSPADRIGERAQKVCVGTKDEPFDQVTVHTANTSDPKRVGLARISGVCRKLMRCAGSRSTQPHHRVELHELGHSIGLHHDGKIGGCKTDTDPINGFMGGNMNHSPKCYRGTFDRMFAHPKKGCLRMINNPNKGVDFP